MIIAQIQTTTAAASWPLPLKSMAPAGRPARAESRQWLDAHHWIDRV